MQVEPYTDSEETIMVEEEQDGEFSLFGGSRFFLEKDLTVKQQEERREGILKVSAARDEGKRAWIYKGKAVIAQFGPPSRT